MLTGDFIRQMPHGRLTGVNVMQGTSPMGEPFDRGTLRSFSSPGSPVLLYSQKPATRLRTNSALPRLET